MACLTDMVPNETHRMLGLRTLRVYLITHAQQAPALRLEKKSPGTSTQHSVGKHEKQKKNSYKPAKTQAKN